MTLLNTTGILRYVPRYTPGEPAVTPDGALGVLYQPQPPTYRHPAWQDDLIGEDIIRTRVTPTGPIHDLGLIAVTDVYELLQPPTLGGPILVVNVLPRRDYYAALVLGRPQPSGEPVALEDLWVRDDTASKA